MDGDVEPEPEPDVETDGDVEPRHRVEIDEAHSGERIDAILADVIGGLSRAQAQRLIDDAHVTLNGLPVKKAGQRLRFADIVEVTVPEPEAIELVPEDLPLAIVFEDPDIIVVDKPAGLVVHPAGSHTRGTLANAILFHCKDLGGIGGALRPGIVHRLDKDTSGVMIVAKTERAHAGLTAAFAAKSLAARLEKGAGDPFAARETGIVRDYLAIASPAPGAPYGRCRTLPGRHPTDRKRFSSRVGWGKSAVTHWQVVERLAGAALVRFRLETGRTHQIRVHAADLGWPLRGARLYGQPSPLIGRQALHAALLEIDHPGTGARMRFESPLPADLAGALAATRS
ncbi:MAG: RluA family pseudouridine synthase, partial [Kofleriaceae bacterium]